MCSFLFLFASITLNSIELCLPLLWVVMLRAGDRYTQLGTNFLAGVWLFSFLVLCVFHVKHNRYAVQAIGTQNSLCKKAIFDFPNYKRAFDSLFFSSVLFWFLGFVFAGGTHGYYFFFFPNHVFVRYPIKLVTEIELTSTRDK